MREAGGLEGMNYLYEAEPNGLILGAVPAGKFIPNKVLNDPTALYELDGFSYILKVDNAQSFFFVSATGSYQSMSDLKAGVNIKISAGSASGSITLAGLTVIKLLSLDAKVVTGFENDAARSLAVQRGEVAGLSCTLGAVKTDVDAGLLKPLFVLATSRDPAAPDVPAITELVNLSEEDLAMVNFWENDLATGTIIMVPAGVSEDKVLFLRNLADKWYQNEEFQQEINKVIGYDVSSYTHGVMVEKSINNISSAIESYQTLFQEMIDKYRM